MIDARRVPALSRPSDVASGPARPGDAGQDASTLASGVERVVIFTLDSLVSGIVVRELVDALPGKVSLVVFSERLNSKNDKTGSPFQQFLDHTRRSGWRFIFTMMLHYFFYHAVVRAGDLVNRLLRRERRLIPLPRLCRERGIPVLRTADVNSREACARIAEARPDLIILAGSDQILRKRVLRIPARGTINIHPSQLPHLRGPTPVFHALVRDVAPAVTVYNVTPAIDAGPILRQATLEREPGESALALECRLMRHGARLALDAIGEMGAGRAAPTPQTPGGSYQSFPSREELGALGRKGIKLFSMSEYLGLFVGGKRRAA
jgi:folate-dependent phosphoribosylglycinamide formyltransferase PurN